MLKDYRNIEIFPGISEENWVKSEIFGILHKPSQKSAMKSNQIFSLQKTFGVKTFSGKFRQRWWRRSDKPCQMTPFATAVACCRYLRPVSRTAIPTQNDWTLPANIWQVVSKGGKKSSGILGNSTLVQTPFHTIHMTPRIAHRFLKTLPNANFDIAKNNNNKKRAI